MKKILLFGAILLGLSACSQYTCPTYAQGDVPTVDTEEVLEKDI